MDLFDSQHLKGQTHKGTVLMSHIEDGHEAAIFLGDEEVVDVEVFCGKFLHGAFLQHRMNYGLSEDMKTAI